jgi:hypothetical protein
MAGNVEIERLVAEMEILPAYRGWSFTYEYPGLFCYSHADRAHLVFFTPDYHGDDQLPIEVQDADGHFYEQHSSVLPLPREGRTAQKIFELVRPTLDALLTPLPGAPHLVLRVGLTIFEIEALRKASECVRQHMAHDQPWAVRDAAMEAIGKVLTAAQEAKPS